jgi:hypothetical protein
MISYIYKFDAREVVGSCAFCGKALCKDPWGGLWSRKGSDCPARTGTRWPHSHELATSRWRRCGYQTHGYECCRRARHWGKHRMKEAVRRADLW